jgi:MFS family permease
LGLVVSLSVLIVAIAQPGVGWLVDRLPARVVAALGLAFIAAGMLITGRAESLPQLIFGYGILVALGLAAVGPVTITPLVSAWFEKRRATALSIVSMGHPFGQLAIVPALTVLVGAVGWRDAYIILGFGLLLIGAPLVLWMLKERKVDGEIEAPLTGCSTRSALRSRSFWQLGFGFFVCGFTMAWVSTYFFDFASDGGVSRGAAASALSMLGGVSIAGTLFMGWWADKHGGTLPLAVVYALRGIGFGLVLLSGSGLLFVFLGMAIIGFSWSSTTPLTSAICATIYGRRSLGTIFGLMFAIMPLGSAVGAALTGLLYDLTGSYEISLVLNLGFGIAAAIAVNLTRTGPIFERPRRRETAPTPAD